MYILAYPLLLASGAHAQSQPVGPQGTTDNNSIAFIEQIGNASRIGGQQTGPGNRTTVSQSGAGHAVDFAIDGQRNGAITGGTISQSGVGASASVRVEGDANTFTVIQSGAPNQPSDNRTDIDITGSENAASVNQLNGLGAAFGNVATIVQSGNGHTADITQQIRSDILTGGVNSAAVDQSGDDHIALINQAGTDNSARIEQSGQGNLGVITQEGEGLQAVIEQDGIGLSYEINQTGCALNGGCAPVIVRQSGP